MDPICKIKLTDMCQNESSRQLTDAAGTGDRPLVQAFLQQGVDVNAGLKDGFTPLMAAATSGHTDIVRDLLSSGAKVDLRDNRGMTALMMAASMGRPDTVKALIAGGADVSARNESRLAPVAVVVLEVAAAVVAEDLDPAQVAPVEMCRPQLPLDVAATPWTWPNPVNPR